MTSSSNSVQAAVSAAPVRKRDKYLVMGNWKMNGSLSANHELLEGLLQGLRPLPESVDIAVCPPFPYLAQVGAFLQTSGISWGAQDVSERESGAYTGEVSAAMLAEFGCQWTLVGHSERRTYHAETDHAVAQKALAALGKGITPVVCVGESLQERDDGQVQSVIGRQLEPVLALGEEIVSRLVVAYEPVWAIGTGRSASAEQAQEVHAFIRSQLQGAAKHIPLLYGGSVKPDNAASLFAMPDIDGALVGGAALVAKDFVAIVQRAAESKA